MFKRGTFIVLILIALLLVCSCKNEPEPNHEVEKIAGAGVLASVDIISQYSETGSYTGVSLKTTDNTACFSFTNATVSTDLSSIDASMGTHTIKVNGEVVYTYEAYPATYPFSLSYNISFSYAGSNHTLELKGRATGVSTQSFSLLKVDGKSYDPSVMNK